jgi:hypothetical protein
MVGDPNQERLADVSVRHAVAFGVFLALVLVADNEDRSAMVTRASDVAATAVKLTDALLQALAGESA